ncbi:thymidylate synthase [Methanocaldococcus fervens]|uniref:Putative thymidylate synthase n=1 Tax=Methanocaldococcus fervens (strain DSM 4213 / JCM 15782 / AG86) TaxID=573064 RepID=C7P6R5_METFA|nr:thymidylate synthase [Methanocaldococcus fervens]ACV24247.1 thymidylate synthase, methanogen type [Methanocaldococcus fervens AG86]
MLCIKKPSVASSFEELIPKILTEGDLVETEFGERTKEIRNTIIEITNPKLKKVPEKYPLGEKAVEEYRKNLLYGSKNIFSYDYHERLFEYPYNEERINQIDYIIEKLNQQKNSRRAIAITWNPKIDIEVSKDERGSVPCLQFIEFLVRDNNLHMTVVFRSNDALLAYVANALGLISLGEYIAEKTNTQLKSYVHHSVSMHVYIDRDRDYIKKYFPEYLKYIE